MIQEEESQTNIKWFWHRLRTMHWREILSRIREKYQRSREKYTLMRRWESQQLRTLPDPILYSYKREHVYRELKADIFGVTLDLDKPIDWHLDIVTGRRFPCDFSYEIDTRSEHHGIVKVVWEINRMQFLPLICQSYLDSGESKYLDLFQSIIESWKKENPYLIGVNWYSCTEAAIRIITWFICWEILAASRLMEKNEGFNAFARSTWIPLIYQHGKHIDRHPSRFSSANNHLIAEGCGLFLVGSYWGFPESEAWKRKGKKILEQQIEEQHSANGINREEASEYIQFITDFFLLAFIVGERLENSFSEKYSNMLHKIISYISALEDSTGFIPYYGDSDDGLALRFLDEEPTENFRNQRMAGALLLNDAHLGAGVCQPSERTKLFFGQNLTIDNAESEWRSNLYSEEGHFIIKERWKGKKFYLHIDAAPLGYLSIAAHGHADALSFVLQLGSTYFFTDVGTYTYHSEPQWRGYFKGTLAHNTVRIDEQDQAADRGPCLWLDHYNCSVQESFLDDSRFSLKASHDGYDSIGVTHHRSFDLNFKDGLLRITDAFEANDIKEHLYEIPFHLHPDVQIVRDSSHAFGLKSKGDEISLELDPILEKVDLAHGEINPILGWYSDRFLQKRPTNVVLGRLRVAGSVTITTYIQMIS